MDQYLTTYRKDYTWPLQPHFVHHHNIIPHKVIKKVAICTCPKNVGKISKSKKESRKEDRPFVGPMCRLLDTKTYPAKTAAPRENEATKFNQPDAYLKKLQDKYPNICGVLQTTPTQQLEAYVNQDRMITTYQMDYCNENSRLTEGQTCTDRNRQSDFDSQFCLQSEVPTHLRHQKRHTEKSETESKKAAKQGRAEFGDGQETRIPPWKSEYQDNLSKTGQAILKYRIHHAVKQVEPAWAMAS